ncbi:MAG: hypothetical protein ABI591_09265 [Kofleriaceae bacterium]
MTRSLNAKPKHNDNPRKLKRVELRGARRGLIGIEVLVTLLAIAVLAMPRTRAGIALIVLVGVTQALGAIMLSLQHVWARRIALVAAMIAILFTVAQILFFDVVTWLELSLLGVGVLESMLVAGCTPRDS